jgi:RNase adaptor protein for sRNA GlmZ degradation
MAPLIININSFSYKRGIPVDESLNGGGYVFDCRLLPNPGRFEQYKHLTGKDDEVIDFFNNAPELNTFFKNVFELIDNHVETYSARGFTHLMINFGCTGGQHRSVYSAEQMAKHLKSKYPQLIVNIRHREQEMKHP